MTGFLEADPQDIRSMAYIAAPTHIATPIRSLGALLAAPFIALYRAMVRLAEADPRYKEMCRLCALSDEDLARIGLSRESIATHVLRGRAI
jgi:uncharacterized protein YjiS (DUF1127 family)